MSYTYQRFMGQIVITSWENDTIEWSEDNGSGGVNVSATIPPAPSVSGAYYPSVLAAEIAAQMTAESAISGDSITYACSVDNDTGSVTITAAAGVFYLKITAAETQKLLTGGDVAAGTRGAQAFGWNVDAGYPAAASTQVSDAAPGACWYPNQPLATYNEGQSESTSVQAVSMGGDSVAYDFSGRSDYLKTYDLSYERMNAASRAQYEDEFWPYAKTGAEFRYHDDRSSVTYTEMVLTGESISSTQFERSDPSLSRWNMPLSMRKHKP